MGSLIVFYGFAAMALVSALFTVTRKNPVVGAVWLVSSFFAVAACYVMLSASFLAVLQVLVYAGAMMVLFVFVIMVLDVSETGDVTHGRPSRIGQIGYYSAIGLSVGFLFWVLAGTMARQFTTYGADLTDTPDFGTADAVGRVLFTDYLFAFEAISMLLIAAVVGAVVVARSRRDREREAFHAGMDDATRHAFGLAPSAAEAHKLVGPTPEHNYGAPSAGGHEGGL